MAKEIYRTCKEIISQIVINDVWSNFNDVFFQFVDNRPDDSYFGKLDSSLKKNTAFVKKLVGLYFMLCN